MMSRTKEDMHTIDARSLDTRQLNQEIRYLVKKGAGRIAIVNICGQRYVGTNLYGLDTKGLQLELRGIPGNDLGAFLDGPSITVFGNAQDGLANTANDGRVIVHGHAGDITCYSARGGEIYIRDYVGYRAAIHMKGYGDKFPVLVIGHSAQDFLCEYMAGGRVVLLGLNLESGQPHQCCHVGTGMHGGVLYVRGTLLAHQLGKEVGRVELTDSDMQFLQKYVSSYCAHFGGDPESIVQKDAFVKFIAVSLRPYGKKYAY